MQPSIPASSGPADGSRHGCGPVAGGGYENGVIGAGLGSGGRGGGRWSISGDAGGSIASASSAVDSRVDDDGKSSGGLLPVLTAAGLTAGCLNLWPHEGQTI